MTRPALLVTLLALTACQHAPEWDRVQALRARGQYVSRVYSSESMHGYKAGDMLLVRAVPFSAVGIGSRVMFWDYVHDRPTFHVVIAKSIDGWVTKGTANRYPDASILTERTFIGLWSRVEAVGTPTGARP